jgi:hypothetical protein
MKLPNGELAVVDIHKLQDYRLSPTHRDGRHKARGFAAAGIRQSDAEELRTGLLAADVNAEALPGTETVYGWHCCASNRSMKSRRAARPYAFSPRTKSSTVSLCRITRKLPPSTNTSGALGREL